MRKDFYESKTTYTSKEEKDSNIEWEKLNSQMVPKLLMVINKKLKPEPVEIVFGFFILFFVLNFIAFYIMLIITEKPPVYFSFLFLGICFSFIVILFLAFVKPFIFPIKKSDIWIFRSKCTSVSIYHSGTNSRPYAYFNIGKEKNIMIKIKRIESIKKEPVGKEYIFYKFNDRKKSPWRAVSLKEFNQAEKENF